LVVSPPRERPIAWSSGASADFLLFDSAPLWRVCRSVRPRNVDVPARSSNPRTAASRRSLNCSNDLRWRPDLAAAKFSPLRPKRERWRDGACCCVAAPQYRRTLLGMTVVDAMCAIPSFFGNSLRYSAIRYRRASHGVLMRLRALVVGVRCRSCSQCPKPSPTRHRV
jgi:hypothetical protein